MSVAIVTGSAGLIGSESVSFLAEKFDIVVGIDNNLRQYFFGEDGSTKWNRERLINQYSDTNRIEDHISYKSDLTKFKNRFPEWSWKYDLNVTLEEIFNGQRSRV